MIDVCMLTLSGYTDGALFGFDYTSRLMDRSLPYDNYSSECFEFTKASVSNCVRKHGACKQQSYWPKRVIDVMPADCLDNDYVVLVEFTPEIDRRYIALSHCWGRAQMFTTTIETKELRMSSIPLLELPRTFRDAVIVVRNLGARYL